MLILVLAAWTGEGLAETYAILSLVGDHVTVVGDAQQVGTRVDRNQRQVVPLSDAALDDFAVRVAYATIGKLRPVGRRQARLR